jgi:hypothetical protein
MNDIIDRIEATLVAAHGREYSVRRARRVPRRMLLGIAAAAAVAVPAAAATSGWDPFQDPQRRLPAPTTSELPPASSLTEQLGVLRRPQTAADRSEPVRRALRGFDNESRGVQLDAVRLLPHGAVLVPAKRFEPRGPDGARPDDTKNDAVCLYSPAGDGTGGTRCHTAREISAGQALGSQGELLDGLVPDGVARVRLLAGRNQVEAQVRDNYFVVAFPAARISPNDPGSAVRADGAEWLNAEGSTIKTFDYTRPPSDAVRPGSKPPADVLPRGSK